ncbi:hypothetical protein [Kitasatospora atroaurantiaca]|nr:hypothetical protein [Kitasatospora atroaurantiaca]
MEAEQLLYAVGLRRGIGNRKLATHGTPAAYLRHLRHNDPPCEACKAANAEDKRTKKQTSKPMPSRRTEIPHGTLAGYRRHLYRKETACEACRAASADAQRARAKNRTAWTCPCGQLNVSARADCSSCGSPR